MSFQGSINKEETTYGRNEKEDDEKSQKNKDLWLSNPKDLKADNESGPSEEEHYFDSDETDVAIVNDIAVINDNPDLPVLTVRSIITGLVNNDMLLVISIYLIRYTIDSVHPLFICFAADAVQTSRQHINQYVSANCGLSDLLCLGQMVTTAHLVKPWSVQL